MCGRFSLYTASSEIAARYFPGSPVAADVPASFNITPGRLITVVRSGAAEMARLDASLWGFRPPWAPADAPRPINIRAEKAATSPYFRSAFAHRRCLVPANGWFEWRRTANGKQPYYLALKEAQAGEVIFFAGLWEPILEEETCCAILTEPVSADFAFIHDRQPVVLDPECRWQWLDPGMSDRETLRRVARRIDPSRLVAYPVSTRVNRPENDDPGLLDPIDETRPGNPGG